MQPDHHVLEKTFDQAERAQWAGRATAYRDSLAALCAHPACPLLDDATHGR